LARITAAYGIDAAPALVIDGRYMTSPATVGAKFEPRDRAALFDATLQVATALVEKAAQSK